MSSTNAALGAPRTVSSAARLQKFQLLNQLLWLCWAGLPLVIEVAYWRFFNSVPSTIANATPEQAKRLRILPNSYEQQTARIESRAPMTEARRPARGGALRRC